jgi:diadenosine tetraphosphatase ApaH/serine/threonine PP2A family protein phosphatase
MFSREALRALLLTGSGVKKDFIDILKALPVQQKRKGITLVHGSPLDPSTDYILYEDEALESFKAFKGACCLFGHTHRQGYFIKTGDNISWVKPERGEVLRYKGVRVLVNPGSIGQPRDLDPRAAWAILDIKKKEVQFFRTEYDISLTQEKMKALGSSEFLINRLSKGE